MECQIFLPMFSSRTFMVLLLIFKSFIHLEFIFVYGVKLYIISIICYDKDFVDEVGRYKTKFSNDA